MDNSVETIIKEIERLIKMHLAAHVQGWISKHDLNIRMAELVGINRFALKIRG